MKKPCYVHANAAPEWLRVPYIIKGYRVNHAIPSCVESLVDVHNETCTFSPFSFSRLPNFSQCLVSPPGYHPVLFLHASSILL